MPSSPNSTPDSATWHALLDQYYPETPYTAVIVRAIPDKPDRHDALVATQEQEVEQGLQQAVTLIKAVCDQINHQRELREPHEQFEFDADLASYLNHFPDIRSTLFPELE